MADVQNKKCIEVLSIGTSELLTPRGTPMRVLRLLRGLEKNDDIKLRVVSRDSNNPVPGSEHIRIEKGFFNIFFKIYRSLKETNADVIVGHTILSLRYLFLFRALFRSKLFLEVHGFTALEAYSVGRIGKIRYIINSQFHKLLFYICDLVTTPSPTGTAEIGKYNSNTHTLLNSANAELFSPEVKPQYDFKKAADEIVVGYAGNSSAYQGLDFLTSVFERISEKDKKYRLVLLLSNEEIGYEKNTYTTILARLPHKSVPGFLASCDILVVPRPDIDICRLSFASKTIEYMAMGKPVISSDVGDASSVIASRVNGMLYEPGDDNSFCEALTYLTDLNCRLTLGKNARETVVNDYLDKNVQDKFYNLIKTLVV